MQGVSTLEPSFLVGERLALIGPCRGIVDKSCWTSSLVLSRLSSGLMGLLPTCVKHSTNALMRTWVDYSEGGHGMTHQNGPDLMPYDSS